MYRTIFFHSTDSTNRVAFALAEQGAAHGTAVIAETQTQGRGRLGKQWTSPAGKGLYCSIVVRPNLSLHDFSRITFVAGLAVAEVIRHKYGLEAGLKWPNDIFFNMKKCGGILTESSGLSSALPDMFAVIGIGLNVNTCRNDFSDDIRDNATSLFLESGRNVVIKELFYSLREVLLEHLVGFESYGFKPVIEQWRKRDFLLGKELTWVAVNGKKVFGTSLGPDDDGLLHVRDAKGVVHEVLSGDIQLAKAGYK